jgi:hypothetical protein
LGYKRTYNIFNEQDMVELEGGHYSVYHGPGADEASLAAADWFPNTWLLRGLLQRTAMWGPDILFTSILDG